METIQFIMMPASKDCRKALAHTKKIVEDRGFKFEVVDMEHLRTEDELKSLHIQGLPTVRREGRPDIFGRYTDRDLESLLSSDIV